MTHKLLTMFIVASAAFGISTVVLGVQYSNLVARTDTSNSPNPATVITSTTTDNPADDDDMTKYRLPTSVAPVSYDLYLYPNLDTGLFTGTVTAEAKVSSATDSIVLHNNKLNITSVLVDGSTASFEVDPSYELLTVRKSDGSGFEASTVCSVVIAFEGDMNDRIVGLYKSSYTNEDGDKV